MPQTTLPRRTRSALFIVAAIGSVLVLLAASCGGGDSEGASATTTTTGLEPPAVSEPPPTTGTSSGTTTTESTTTTEPPTTTTAAPATTTTEPPTTTTTTTPPTTTTTTPPTTTTTTPPTTTTTPPTTTTEPPTTTTTGEPPGYGGDSGDGAPNPADITSQALCEAADFSWNDENAECSEAAERSEAYDAPGDLKVPQPLPAGEPGEIIDTERLEVGDGLVAYRILHHSRSIRGDDIAVSGFVATPAGDPPQGGWPLVAWAHGTTGMADKCAPSMEAESIIAQYASLIAGGYAIAATDYEGLGTPGIHPYIVGGSEARGVLDSVRAVQGMPELSVSEGFVVWGHSQGGHAALHAGQAWQEYAPELNLLGVVSGAPPSQFTLIYDVLTIGPYRGYLVMAFAAFADAYEDANLEDIFRPEALAELDILEEECLDEVLANFADVELRDLQTVDNPLRVEPWDDLALQNDVNQKPVPAPLLILHGGDDAQVPAVSSLFLLGQLCSLAGQGPTQRIEYPGEGHSAVVLAYLGDMLEWIGARFAGEDAPNSCADS